MKKLDKLYHVSFIALTVFFWIYFGMHVIIHVIFG